MVRHQVSGFSGFDSHPEFFNGCARYADNGFRKLKNSEGGFTRPVLAGKAALKLRRGCHAEETGTDRLLCTF